MERIDIKLPFGLRDGALIHISEVSQGLSCKCVCPECKTPLIAAKGSKMQHHFKHSSEANCSGGLETVIHLKAKEYLIESKKIKLPHLSVFLEKKDSRGKIHKVSRIFSGNGHVVVFDEVYEEYSINGIIADVYAIKNKIPLIVEVFYSNKCDEEKISKIKSMNISAIEIDLSCVTQEILKSEESFRDYVLSPHNSVWLYNSRAQEYQQKLVPLLDSVINKHEALYLIEQEEQLKLIENEKSKLKGILKLIDAMSCIEAMNRYRSSASSHKAWTHFQKVYNCEIIDLPNYVNIPILHSDWIFFCDRRVWQSAVFSTFCGNNNDKLYCAQNILSWMLKSRFFSVYSGFDMLYALLGKFPKDIPDSFKVKSPNPEKVIQDYLDSLAELGRIEKVKTDRKDMWKFWYKNKKAKD